MILQRPYILQSDVNLDSRLHPPPPPVTYCVTFLLILLMMLTASCIFIEIVAAFTKMFLDAMADHMVYGLMENPVSVRPPAVQPNLFKHQLLDEICPLTSHTPPELPTTETKSLLPPKLASPCAICTQGVTMGDLVRKLPCNHMFHARCIDRACIAEGDNANSRASLSGYIECPKCAHVIFPTPDLVKD